MVLPPKAKKETDVQHIQAFARMRPFNQQEIDSCTKECVSLTDKEVAVKIPHGIKKYTFNKVFNAESNQRDVYKSVCEPIIQEVLLGYNCTIFAYGQTGTGKTYTMVGEEAGPDVSYFENSDAGIIPRAIDHMFASLKKTEEYDFTIRVSYMEIYNEVLTDLLATDESKTLKIYEDSKSKGSVQIHGLEEVTVFNKRELHNILKLGSERKNMAATALNLQSSRSHTVFTITIHGRETTPDGEELVRTGKLNLVDLAGSENINKSGAVEKRAREAANINQSLLALGRVIKALVDKSSHIPYRESKLTRILQDSLGGKTKTTIIATFTPASINVDETVSTLEYAIQARNITIRPEINQKVSKTVLIQNYLEQIERLKKDLTAAQKREGIFLNPENYNMMLDEEAKLREKLCKSVEECSEFNYRIQEMIRVNEELQNGIGMKEIELKGAQESLNKFKKNYKNLRKQRRVQQELIDLYDDSQTQQINYANGLSKALDKFFTEHGMLRNKVDELYNNQDNQDKSANALVNSLNTERSKMVSTMHTWNKLIENVEGSLSKVTKDYFENENKFIDKFKTDISPNQITFKNLAGEIMSNLKNEIRMFGEYKTVNQQIIQEAALEIIDQVLNTKAHEIFKILKKVEQFKAITEEKINKTVEDLSQAFHDVDDKFKKAAAKIKTESKELELNMHMIADKVINLNGKVSKNMDSLTSKQALYNEKMNKRIHMQKRFLAELESARPNANDKKILEAIEDRCVRYKEDLTNLRKITSDIKCVVDTHTDYIDENMTIFSKIVNLNAENTVNNIQQYSQDLEGETQKINNVLNNSISDVKLITNEMIERNKEITYNYEKILLDVKDQQEKNVQGILDKTKEIHDEFARQKVTHFQHRDEIYKCMNKQHEDVENFSVNLKVVPKTGATPARLANLQKTEMPSKVTKKMAVTLFKTLEEEPTSSCDNSTIIMDDELADCDSSVSNCGINKKPVIQMEDGDNNFSDHS